MRIYDIEFDIDSFLDEMEGSRGGRQRQQQIHRSNDLGAGVNDGPARRDTTTAGLRGRRRLESVEALPTRSGNGSIGSRPQR